MTRLAISFSTMTQIPVSYRRLIRRRILVYLTVPSPPQEMKKKKPKRSSAFKASPKSALAKSASPQTKSPLPKIDVTDLTSLANKDASDAQIDPTVDAVAQPPANLSDSSHQTVESQSDRTVIVDESADPSSFHDEDTTTQTVSSPKGLPPSSSA